MIKFTKMHGLGNDYVYIDATAKTGQKIENESDLAKFVSNRHFGIGSDGLILLCKSNIADLKMRMFNKDGTEAQMCGNGIRCVAKLAYELGLIERETATIETLSGIKSLKLNITKGKVNNVEVDMGEPILIPEKIPIIKNESVRIEDKKIKAKFKINKKEFEFTCVSIGNPHAVTFVKDLSKIEINMYGPIFENLNIFPEKTNVEFVEIVDKDNIKMRVWERGTGETLACGTGACSSVVAGYLNNFTNRKVNVELLGGNLGVEWKSNNHIYMNGPAVTVFKGEWINE